MPETSCVVAMTTLPVEADAVALARVLIDARLAACVQIGAPMTSVYRWEGAIEQDNERIVLMKTTRDRVPALWTTLKVHHPYAVPEFVVLPIEGGNPAYLAWLASETLI